MDASEEASEAMRREHVRLIRDLLIAINFPDKARAKVEREGVRLPLILTSVAKRRDEDGETTPNASEKEESERNSTPTPPGRPTLPKLSQLLNDMPSDRDRRGSRPMNEREMECDV